MSRVPTVKLVAVTVVSSLAASVVLVTGIRVAQRATAAAMYEATSVTVDLPETRVRPDEVTLGLHRTTLVGSWAMVAGRLGATGLLSAVTADGAVRGQGLVIKDPLLRASAARVDYDSTARALVLQTPALATSSPLLAALIDRLAGESPAVRRLAAQLRVDSRGSQPYLTAPSPSLTHALDAASADVSQRVRQVLAVQTATASSLPTLPAAPGMIVLADTNHRSSCATHAVADGLCFTHTYPASSDGARLVGTNWTSGWQALFGYDGAAPPDTLQLPVALLAPMVNAPPTIAGLIEKTTQSAVTWSVKAMAAAYCRKMIGQIAGACDHPDFLTELRTELLQQLTLAGSDEELVLPLDNQLIHHSLVTYGAGQQPAAQASRLEVGTWAMSQLMTLGTGLLLPLMELILDSRDVVHSGRTDTGTGTQKPGRQHHYAEVSQAFHAAYTAQAKLDASRVRLGAVDQELQRARQTSDKSAVRHWAATKGGYQRSVNAQQKKVALAWQSAKDKSAAETEGGGRFEATAALIDVGMEYANALTTAYLELRSGLVAPALATLEPILAVVVAHFFKELLEFAISPEVLTRFLGAAALQVVLAMTPGLDDLLLAIRTVDLLPSAFGLAQDIVDFANTERLVPARHQFPTIAGNRRHGSRQVPALFVGAARGGELLDGVVHRRIRFFLARSTTVCPDTVIVPAAPLAGRRVGIFNTHNAADLHFAGGLGRVEQQPAQLYGNAVPFAAVHSPTPLGAGAVSFADPPRRNEWVSVAAEGGGTDVFHNRAFRARVVQRIPGRGDPLVLRVRPVAGSPPLSTDRRFVGGLVYAASGPAQGELVGLAEVEEHGTLTVLTGAGIADVSRTVTSCAGGE